MEHVTNTTQSSANMKNTSTNQGKLSSFMNIDTENVQMDTMSQDSTTMSSQVSPRSTDSGMISAPPSLRQINLQKSYSFSVKVKVEPLNSNLTALHGNTFNAKSP